MRDVHAPTGASTKILYFESFLECASTCFKGSYLSISQRWGRDQLWVRQTLQRQDEQRESSPRYLHQLKWCQSLAGSHTAWWSAQIPANTEEGVHAGWMEILLWFFGFYLTPNLTKIILIFFDVLRNINHSWGWYKCIQRRQDFHNSFPNLHLLSVWCLTGVDMSSFCGAETMQGWMLWPTCEEDFQLLTMDEILQPSKKENDLKK